MLFRSVYMNYLRFLHGHKKCRLFPFHYEKFVLGKLRFNPLRQYLEDPKALEYLVKNRNNINYAQVYNYIKQFLLNPSWDEHPPLNSNV
mgnify:FL=1